jgi:hypothetical protein
MRKFLLQFVIAFTGFIPFLSAQGALPSDTLQARVQQVFADTRNTLVEQFIYRSDSNARAEKMYGRWANHWYSRLFLAADDERQMFTTYPHLISGMFEPINPYMDTIGGTHQTLFTGPTLTQRCIASYPAAWGSLGPEYYNWGSTTKMDKAGHASCVWVDPTNPNYILIGSFASGIWETTDGGKNWSNATDNSSGYTLGPIGVKSIAVHPSTNNIQYFASNYARHLSGWGGFFGFSRGVFFRNYNTGAFLPDIALAKRLHIDGLKSSERFDIAPGVLAFSPSGRLYTAYKGHLYYRSSFSQNTNNPNFWTKISLSMVLPAHYQIRAMAVSKINPSKIAFATNTIGNTMYLIQYDEASSSATVKAITTPNTSPVVPDWREEFNTQGVANMEFAYDGDVLYLTFLANNTRTFNKITSPWGTSPTLHFISNLGATFNTSFTISLDLSLFVLHPHHPNLIYFGNSQGPDPFYFSLDRGLTMVEALTTG